MANTTEIDAKNIVFVGWWQMNCGNCRVNLVDVPDTCTCEACGTSFLACVSTYRFGNDAERKQCAEATGLQCIGTGEMESGKYDPYPT